MKNKSCLKSNKNLFRACWMVILAFLVVTAMVKLVATNQLATRGGELGHLEQRVSELRTGNQSLRREIARRSSLAILKGRAGQLGMLEGSGRIDTVRPQVLASR